MRIENHLIAGLTYQQAHYIGNVITPSIVVLHDTAGRLEKGNSAAYLASANSGKASVHFVVERDGTIVQQVPTNRRANHAGQSSFQGREGCNGFSIGIEIVNPGRMIGVGNKAKAWWGQTFTDGDDIRIFYRETPEHGPGFWMDYTEEQIASVIALLEVLFRDISTLTDITTHWYVSPGRKIDTNPLFPLGHIRARILGREDPAETAADAGSTALAWNEDDLVQVDARGDTLNMRRWPSFNPNVIATIPDDAVVTVIRKGLFAGRVWLRVLYGGQEGWIVARYTAEIARPGGS